MNTKDLKTGRRKTSVAQVELLKGKGNITVNTKTLDEYFGNHARCKAAVKGNSLLSVKEAEALIDELLGLDNPYHCPHGRPTMIVFTQSDMDKKFKRIVT